MRILVTGCCGFVGSSLITAARESGSQWAIVGLDNFTRPGSESNASKLKTLGVQLARGDLRSTADMESLPAVDWVIDAAAVTSVRAGTDGQTSSRQLIEHNLVGTFNLLEYCKRSRAGLILLSTSRVYSIAQLNQIELDVVDQAFVLKPEIAPCPGLTSYGVNEQFSTHPPLSLYGATKAASETLAIEYGWSFEFPVWINRCGVMAGAGQLGKADQGIFSYWIHSHCHRRPLKYIGFAGNGHQVRDCLHPRDLLSLIRSQLDTSPSSRPDTPQVINVSGGIESAISLKQLTDWCDERFGSHHIGSTTATQKYDVPWLVLDASNAQRHWNWQPATSTRDILNEIANHAESHPEWLSLSS